MKKPFFATIFFLSAVLLLQAQPPEGDASPGDTYGAAFNKTGAKPIAQLPSTLKGDKPVTTKVEAKVLDVCPKMGCWIKLEVNDSTTAFVKMKDYAFFVPTAIKGKTVVLDAEAFEKTTSVNELKHYAEDAKKPKEEIDAITKPKKEIRLVANGIQVL